MSDNSTDGCASESPASQNPRLVQLLTSIKEKEQAGKAQLFFAVSVLDKYRKAEGFRVIRTDTTGRVSKPGTFSVDFGISGDSEQLIHISVETWVYKIPKSELDHWLSHMQTFPVSDNYLRALIRPGCMDDGPIRNW